MWKRTLEQSNNHGAAYQAIPVRDWRFDNRQSSSGTGIGRLIICTNTPSLMYSTKIERPTVRSHGVPTRIKVLAAGCTSACFCFNITAVQCVRDRIYVRLRGAAYEVAMPVSGNAAVNSSYCSWKCANRGIIGPPVCEQHGVEERLRTGTNCAAPTQSDGKFSQVHVL